MGHEDGVPVLRIDELVYLPRLATSTPRRAGTASAPATPVTGKRLFGGCKQKAGATNDATDEAVVGGAASASKRPQGNAAGNTLINKLQISAATSDRSPTPPPTGSMSSRAASVSPPPVASTSSCSAPATPSHSLTTRSAGKRRAL